MALRLASSAQRPRPFWLLISAATLVPAPLATVTTSLNFRLTRGIVDWSAVASYSALWLFFGALTPLIYVLARRYPLGRERFGRNVAAQLAGALVLCIAWTSLSVLLATFLNRRPPQESFLRFYFSWFLTNLPWSVFLYATVFGCKHSGGRIDQC